ncbi:hypothetical protein GOBAR_AA28782 [Gossypium barbadense]|uniref:Uncharacterized protein n=1 Tax=Gossypium barbadense TaxID=3634 RepID=A0A2P5WLD3_GOSBA|nr:hypothetical protein GOBAR_AA28782 [Gossypium barbadense]
MFRITDLLHHLTLDFRIVLSRYLTFFDKTLFFCGYLVILSCSIPSFYWNQATPCKLRLRANETVLVSPVNSFNGLITGVITGSEYKIGVRVRVLEIGVNGRRVEEQEKENKTIRATDWINKRLGGCDLREKQLYSYNIARGMAKKSIRYIQRYNKGITGVLKMYTKKANLGRFTQYSKLTFLI